MSDTLGKIRKSWMEARKTGTSELPPAPTLSTYVAECEMIGKNRGNRAVTEPEVIRYLRQTLASVEYNIYHYGDDEKSQEFVVERDFINSLLPAQVDEETLREFIENLGDMHIGQIMGAVKKEFGENVDMALASKIAKA